MGFLAWLTQADPASQMPCDCGNQGHVRTIGCAAVTDGSTIHAGGALLPNRPRRRPVSPGRIVAPMPRPAIAGSSGQSGGGDFVSHPGARRADRPMTSPF